jgi:hypothetical protein
MSESKRIHCTKDYTRFEFDPGENRRLDMKKHKKLEESMDQYGYLWVYPVVCKPGKNGKLVMTDGQHRFTHAEQAGLPVYYVVSDVDFDVAVVNSAAKTWELRDYAEKHFANGLTVYKEALDFTDRNRLGIGIGFALLAGTTSWSNCRVSFINGTFKVKDREWAERVASIIVGLRNVSPKLNRTEFFRACMAVSRVKDFDPARLIHNAARCREKLLPYGTQEAYLDMLEHVYNHNRRGGMFPLKVMAMNAMRERNAAETKKARKEKGERGAA